MNTLMEQLYDDFIAPHIARQPKDKVETLVFDEYKSVASLDEQDRANTLCQFYALHAFLLGLKMGQTLSESFRAPG